MQHDTRLSRILLQQNKLSEALQLHNAKNELIAWLNPDDGCLEIPRGRRIEQTELGELAEWLNHLLEP